MCKSAISSESGFFFFFFGLVSELGTNYMFYGLLRWERFVSGSVIPRVGSGSMSMSMSVRIKSAKENLSSCLCTIPGACWLCGSYVGTMLYSDGGSLLVQSL